MWSNENEMVHQSIRHDGSTAHGTSSASTNVVDVHQDEYLPRPIGKSYLSVPGEAPLLGITTGELFDRATEKYSDSQGLIVSDIGIYRTFSELKQEVNDLAAGLVSIGLKKGDRIGIWGPNSHQYYIVQMAVWKAGLILVNINSAYQAPELKYCLENVGVKCLFIAENFKTQNFYEMTCKIVTEVRSSPPGEIMSKVLPEFTTLITMGISPLQGAFTFTEIMQKGQSASAKALLHEAILEIQFDDVCNIQFTSGTTGSPKGAMLTHHNIVNNSYFIGRRFAFTEKDRICLTVPLFHCYGSVIGTLVALHNGCTCVFPASAFSGLASIEAAAKEKCTIIYGTPTMHIAMMNVPDFANYDLSSLRFACTAGAICPEELIREMKSKYTVDTVGSLYGMTETSPVFFQSLPSDTDKQRAESVGYPMSHCEVKVVDTAGRIVPIGTPGEMCCRGFVTMCGYWGDKEKTDMVIKPTKWLHTGDLMVMSETGHGTVIGRLKDTIIRGGENIYPKEVEEYLHSHQSILEACVFGIPDSFFGEEVTAWIKLKEGTQLTEQEIRDFCRGNIAHYKIPKFIIFVEDFPKTVSGKLQKFKMRDETLILLDRK